MASEEKLRIINIVQLSSEHKEEIIKDLLRIQRECGITDVAFMMPLHPEGYSPTQAKAKYLRDLFIEMRKPLENTGLCVGILIQSTLGHAATEAGFKRRVNAKGVTAISLCPLDPEFQDYIKDAVAIVAATKPAFMLVDDDFRLARHGSPGCFCELHMASLEKAVGRAFDRENLLAALEGKSTEAVALKKTWNTVRLESLLVVARKIREAINSADPGIPCGFCICDDGGMELDFAHAIEKTLAGGNPKFVRVHNSWYMSQDPRDLLSRLYWTSAQIQTMKDIPEILAESDTYPHNRYCTPAKALNAQIIFSLAHGCTGLKLWISRLYGFEPESGKAYREMLKANIGLYRTLRNLIPHVKWQGPTTPFCSEISELPASGNQIRSDNWSCSVLGRMGIPCRTGSNAESDVFMLTGGEIAKFSDDELKNFLSKSVMLDGSAAEALTARGLASLAGVKADSPKNWKADLEFLNDDIINGKSRKREFVIAALSPGLAFRLKPDEGAKIRILSTIRSWPFWSSAERKDIGPGLVLFENQLGGRIATFACKAGFTPFLHETRREQLLGVLGWLNRIPLPVTIDSDIDIYAMHGTIDSQAGGGELLCVFDLNMDSLEEIKLRFGGKAPSSIEVLCGDGGWKTLKWKENTNSSITVKIRLESVTPLVFRAQR